MEAVTSPAVWAHILVFLVVLAAGGCRVNDSWHEVNGDCPWAGPGSRVRAERRSFAYVPIPAGGVEDRWTDSAGNAYDPRQISLEVDALVHRTSDYHSWLRVATPDHPEWDRRVAPFHFYIVSVRPVVVIMRPIDPADSRPWMSPEEGTAETLGMPWFANYLEVRTWFPYQPNLLWLSPDLHRPASPVELEGEGRAVIPLPSGRLVLEAQDGRWKARRE